MVLSVIETEEECKKAPSTLGGVHSLHNNTPQWPKPEAASTSTAAPAASTACRSPRTVGDSPHTSTFLELRAFFGSAEFLRVLTQDESSLEASSTAAHSRAAGACGVKTTTGA